MVLFGGEVYVARTHIFDCLSPVGYDIYRWDGESWYVDQQSWAEADGAVHAMVEFNGELILAGEFSSINGVSANRIARWDGANWHTLGDGVNGPVYGMTVHNGNLYVGGDFSMAGGSAANSVARWDGANWHALDQGIDDTVEELTSYAGELIVGGSFTTAGGSPAASVASWNGTTWSALGSGVTGSVLALTEYDGHLYAGGSFDSAGGIGVSGIARWSGSAWSSISLPTSSAHVTDLIQLGDKLVIGGAFSAFQMMDSTVVEANAVATWDNTEFLPMDSGLWGGLTA
jgi:hypothetical protein